MFMKPLLTQNRRVGSSGDSRVLQVVNTQTGAVATGTTVMPSDDTIPQITEGDEYMTLAITPRKITSILQIDVVANVTNGTGVIMTAALFQDSTADALAAAKQRIPTAGQMVNMSFRHRMVAGSLSATTFRVRLGASIAGTTTFNGEGGSRLYGGVCASSITITEIRA